MFNKSMQVNITANLRNLYTRIDAIPAVALLAANACLALLVCFAHGGAVIMSYLMPLPAAEAEQIRGLAIFTVPVASFVMLTTLVALLRRPLRNLVLAAHAWVLTIGAFVLWAWAAGIMLAGLPPKSSFSWTPGLLTFTVGYAVFLACRYGLPVRLRERAPALYAPFVAMAGALVVDLGVFFRTIMLIAAWFGR